MSDDNILRQDIRRSLSHARRMIRSYSGLYSGEDLARDVLKICDDIIGSSPPTARLKEARCLLHDRCMKLTQDADRFSVRDPAAIAAARARALASLDVVQDVLLAMRKAEIAPPRTGALLRKRSL